MNLNAKQVEFLIQQLTLLVVDDNPFMRNLVRSLVLSICVKTIYGAGDGITALGLIRTIKPDLLVLDLEMPMLNGAELVRIVRSPGVFPAPDVPIIVLTAHGERRRIVEAARLGINEFLCKSVSIPKRCTTGCLSILLKPRERKARRLLWPAPRLPVSARAEAS